MDTVGADVVACSSATGDTIHAAAGTLHAALILAFAREQTPRRTRQYPNRAVELTFSRPAFEDLRRRLKGGGGA